MLLSVLFAQAAVVAAPQATAAPTQGVISYPVSFFDAARPANALEMVQRIPGFTLDIGDEVRGFEGAAGNVLIDGQRPASKSDVLDQLLQRIPVSQIERIDLIRGGAPGIDMQGKTVLANVIRKSGGGFRGLAAWSANYVVDDGRTAPSIRLEASGGKNGRAWEVSARSGVGFDDGSGDGPGLRLDPIGRPLLRSFIESEGATLQTTLAGSYEQPIFAGKLRVNVRLFRDNFNYDEQNHIRAADPDVMPAPSVLLDQWGQDKFETEAGARYSRDLGARASLELVGLQQTKDFHLGETFQTPADVVFFTVDNTSGESIARAVLKYRQTDRLSWEGGAEGAFNWLEGETRFVENGDVVELPAANVRVEEKRGEAFVKLTWRPTPKWTLEGGLRQEGSAISSKGDVTLEKTLYFTKPRLALTWAPTERTQLRARYERVVGQLDFDDFVASSNFNTGGAVVAGNPDLEPEQAWVSEVAVEQRFLGSGALILTLRHSDLADVIDRAPVFAGDQVFDARVNIGDGTKDEILLSATLPFDRLGWKGAQLRGEATWRESEVVDPTTRRKREISGLRPLEWEAHFTHDLPQWRMNWGVDAFGAWRETYYRFDEIELRKLKTYVVGFVEWKPRTDLSIRAELSNLTERGFRNTRYHYDGPRGAAPFAYVDDRDIQFGRMVYVRLRKTFGG
jgi:outer membrane receptor protein involved in Fe transport